MNTLAIDRATEAMVLCSWLITSDAPMKLVASNPAIAASVRRRWARSPRPPGTASPCGDGRRAAVSVAARTADRNRFSSKGFSRKSKAPARIAATARSTDPCAVITTTQVSGAICSMSVKRPRPSRSGSIRSSSTTGGRVSRNSRSPSAAVSAACTGKPAAVSTDR